VLVKPTLTLGSKGAERMTGFFSRVFGGGGVEGAWTSLLAQLRAAGGDPQIEAAARELLIPMGVIPERFIANHAFLDVQGMEVMLPEGTGKLNTTPSIKSFMRTIDRPQQPKWFLAAFPDVAEWVSANMRAKEDAFDARVMKLLEANHVSLEDDAAIERIMHGPDGKPGSMFCRRLVEWYVEETGRKLETTIP
jgi:hypothetical protein